MNRWLPFEWIVAARFLREGRVQTGSIVGGVAIGVAVIVFMSVLLTGLQANFIRRVLSAQPHIQLLPARQVARVLGAGAAAVEAATVQPPLQRVLSIDQWQAIVEQLRAMPRVRVVSPSAGGSALVARGDASRAVSIVGIEPSEYYRIVDLPGKIVDGSTRLTATDILIGLDLATDLGLQVGDKLRLAAGNGATNVLTVSGIVDLGSKSANMRTIFVALHTAQSLLGLTGGVSSIDVTVDDVYAAEDVARAITAATGVEADSWIHTNAQFFSAVRAQVTANTTIRFCVGLSVAFGIASVLFVSVVQKRREIGILRAMGVTRGQVMRVFLLQGGVLGLAGSLLGSALGAIALVAWRRFAVGADGQPIVPVVMEPALFGVALVLASVAGLVAAAAPALRAARLDPVVAIRA
ncbi:MAG TPA: FtsX-like permease family protein [Caldimonas sp.]